VRFDTLSKICEVLDCQPGDLLEYRADDGTESDQREPTTLARRA
jgi:putative transcriptional regulator